MAFKSFTLLRQITWNETIYSLSSQEYQQLKELKYNELITFLKLASQRKYTLTSCQRYGLDKVALNLIILNTKELNTNTTLAIMNLWTLLPGNGAKFDRDRTRIK